MLRGRSDSDLSSLGDLIDALPMDIVLFVHKDVIVTPSIAIADIVRFFTVIRVGCCIIWVMLLEPQVIRTGILFL